MLIFLVLLVSCGEYEPEENKVNIKEELKIKAYVLNENLEGNGYWEYIDPRKLKKLNEGYWHTDDGKVYESTDGSVTAMGDPDSPGFYTYYFQSLYFLDKNAPLRFSHENPDVQKLYADFMGQPLSHRAHQLLHTDHQAWAMPRSDR